MGNLDKEKVGTSTLLLLSVFVIATCGLIYELIAGTLASYLLGDSVLQFSTIIGTYLFAMGIGSYLSRFLKKNLIQWFIKIELLIGFIGGFTSVLLFTLFNFVVYFQLILYGLVGITGVLVGFEIPVLMRILKDKFEFNQLVSEVFTFDYIGALLASLIFPLFFVPQVGLIRTSLFFGLINVVVAIWVAYKFKSIINGFKYLIFIAWSVLILILVCFVMSKDIELWTENLAYNDKVILSQKSPYQKIIITRNNKDYKLFINGNLQFSTSDEYRYHEALVHPVISLSKNIDTILVLGGGDGLAVRELLKYKEIKKIFLVDLDPMMTDMFKQNILLKSINKNSLSHSIVEVINKDAFAWLHDNKRKFNTIIIDFPDPSNYSLGKLYSLTFFKKLKESLHIGASVVIQSTSPWFARKSYWCVESTLQAAGFNTIPYHAYIPSFGEWGYIIGYTDTTFTNCRNMADSLQYINPILFEQMRYFPQDMSKCPVDINRLNNQILVHYFEKEWSSH